jgi:prepilin-type N-terminal cleavage/methylation domain-containing protein
MKATGASQRPAGRRRRFFCAGPAFTLIEIMVVVGIIGLVMGMGVPSLYQLFRKDGFRKAVSDVVEVCNSARARAILQQAPAEVVFYLTERRCEVAGGTGGVERPSRLTPGSGVSARFPDDIVIEMLDVNLREYKNAEEAHVRFYPNGTSDEMTLILRSNQNEWRKISLEVTTGLVSVESDPNKWR